MQHTAYGVHCTPEVKCVEHTKRGVLDTPINHNTPSSIHTPVAVVHVYIVSLNQKAKMNE